MDKLPDLYLNYGKSRFEPIFNPLRWIFNVSVGLFMIYHAYKTLSEVSNITIFAFAIFLGWLLGDAFTGFIHFCLDNFSFKKIPYLNKAAILFQGHHLDPLGITRHPLSLVMFEPLVLVVLYHALLYDFANEVKFGAPFTAAFTFISGFSQLSHRLSHSDAVINAKPNFITIMLRKCFVFVEPKHHTIHHSNNYMENYAIGSGISDKIMNYVYPFILKLILAVFRR